MEKKITVYIVSANSKETVYATKSQATVAIDTLAKWDIRTPVSVTIPLKTWHENCMS